MITNPHHLKIIDSLNKADPNGPVSGLYMVHYCGSDKSGYNLNTAEHTKIINDFIKKNSLSKKEAIDFISSLFKNGQTYNEIIIGGSMVGKLLINDFDPDLLNIWLNYVHGWAETDVLCQSNFTPDILLSNWSAWKKNLTQFTISKNVHKRRASLVLLCKPLRLSSDPRLFNMALNNTEKLKPETDILITKAISWILRSMVPFHRDSLTNYLNNNQATLPKIAYREAYTKLTTGRKYNRPQKSKN